MKTIDKAVIAAILCRSYRNPITGKVLADQFGVDIRKITQIIEEARDSGIKIASSKGGRDDYIGGVVPAGYYQAHSPEEMRSTFEMYRSTIKQLSSRAKAIMNFNGQNPTIFEQYDEIDSEVA